MIRGQRSSPECRQWAAFLGILFSVLTLLAYVAADPPRHSNGFTNVVTWDNYTVFLHDHRMFLHAGEFHTFRLPVPDLWLDIFQKMVAAGLNSVSIYIHMGATNPAPGVLDFNDWRSLETMYQAAKIAGIFVVLRPGPYINGETTSGGIAHWITSQVAGTVRTNATDWTAAYRPYIDGIIEQSSDFQVSKGGPLLAVQIDNENRNSPDPSTQQYFADLEKQYRDGGIDILLTYNDPGMRSGFINGTGAVDIYGLDAYPNGFNCSTPRTWSHVTSNYHQYHEQVNPSQPWYMPEFQGGSFDPWGGPGYDACEVLTGPDFQDVFYKHNWAANAKLVSYYMFYGGTSWGGFPFPGVYTSYDYGSSIRETRALTDKFDEVKRQGLFLRSSPQFLKTDWMGNSSLGIPGVTLNGSSAFVTSLRNPDSGTWFHVTRQSDSSSTANITFTLTVPTSQGTVTLPRTTGSIAINGRQSKLVITDYSFGVHGSVLYTTAAILFAGTIGSRDVLFLHGFADQSHEFALKLSGSGERHNSTRVMFDSTTSPRFTTIAIQPGGAGLLTLWDSDEQLVLFADPVTAATFWAPAIHSETPETVPGFEHFWQFGTNTTALVSGPYLVRNATLNAGTLVLRGDLNASVPLTIVAPAEVKRVTWNGEHIAVKEHGRGLLTGQLKQKTGLGSVKVPELTGWKYADSLPEVQAGFDDSKWIIANKTRTNIFQKPLFGDGRVLYGCDYGFCENTVLWRGHFNGTGAESSVNLTIYGGTSFASSVWINDHFINTVSSSADHVNALFPFPSGSVEVGEDNVITVVQENMGNDEQSNIKPARGIAGFQLNTGNITTWRVQGKLGGYTAYPDKVRGVMNEGGLFGEHEGWHLPGFDTSRWARRDLSEGLPGGGAGIGFFVTTFDLAFPKDVDGFVSFQFEDEDLQPYRALLFVNGWMFGKRVANLGPQTKFPVQPGILDFHGKNTVAVVLWALENTPVSPSLKLVVDDVLDGGVGPVTLNNPRWEKRA
ncbi:glycoside hydrolase family 35 protein [Polyporus arcularius HHB13444]|uniref:beta-galactosidase n=1 Tax=Polyporus arcularius HHB13444 TaxID=1314778 RepID=A0A5C3PPY7_9APHY|nr:glycoside hydrolase family 35 protein [Polyporus arcularius HHB13444]